MATPISTRTGRRHLRFVLVTGRTPRPRSFCALCCEPVGQSYLREIGTRLLYCDHDCYTRSDIVRFPTQGISAGFRLSHLGNLYCA